MASVPSNHSLVYINPIRHNCTKCETKYPIGLSDFKPVAKCRRKEGIRHQQCSADLQLRKRFFPIISFEPISERLTSKSFDSAVCVQ